MKYMRNRHRRQRVLHPGSRCATRILPVLTVIFLVSVSGLPRLATADGKRTRIVDTACGTYDELADRQVRAVGESILGAVIQNTLGRLGAALRSAGEASTKTTSVHSNIEVAPGKPAKCLIIARGRWSASGGDVYKDGLDTEIVHLSGTPERLLANPDFVVRLAVQKSSDYSALKLRPVFLEYGRHLADSKRGSRGLSLEIAFHGPGQASDHKDAVGTSLVLGDFESGHRYDLQTGKTEEWDKRRAHWKPVSEQHLPMQEESHWFPTYAPTTVAGADASAGNQKTPKIITAAVAETRAARPILLFLADVFDASSGDIQASLESKLLKSEREKGQQAAAKAKNDQLVELVTAVADANIAIESYCAMGDGRTPAEYLTARKDMFIVMNKANFVAGGLGQPLPFPSVPTPSQESPSTWAQCPQQP